MTSEDKMETFPFPCYLLANSSPFQAACMYLGAKQSIKNFSTEKRGGGEENNLAMAKNKLHISFEGPAALKHSSRFRRGAGDWSFPPPPPFPSLLFPDPYRIRSGDEDATYVTTNSVRDMWIVYWLYVGPIDTLLTRTDGRKRFSLKGNSKDRRWTFLWVEQFPHLN